MTSYWQEDGKSAMGPSFFPCLPFGPLRKRWMMANFFFGVMLFFAS
jgi:hypothetical protein